MSTSRKTMRAAGTSLRFVVLTVIGVLQQKAAGNVFQLPIAFLRSIGFQ